MNVSIHNLYGESHKEKIIYIEYFDGMPHKIITEGKRSSSTWDIEKDHLGFDKFIHYNSGSGALEIEASDFVRHDLGSYWVHPKAKIINKPKMKRLHLPIKYDGVQNPFKLSREVLEMVYCERCNHVVDESLCEHLEFKDDGLFYIDGQLHESYA